MTSTDVHRNAQPTSQRHNGATGNDQRRKALFATETRRSFTTSEFWLTIVASVVMIVVGYADDNGLGVNRAWALTAGVIGLYILSRGIAKAGSSDPQVRDLDDLG
jgi:hypothetical protein